MSAVDLWLSDRRPTPPRSLKPALRMTRDGASIIEALTLEGCDRMRQASARLGAVRDSAFHLLAADALVTYACEAALEAEDPGEALSMTLQAVASPAGARGEG